MGFIEFVTYLDHQLFLLINGTWTNSVFDLIFPFITDLNHKKWIGPLIFALLIAWVATKRSQAFVWIFVLVLSVGLSDFVSYRVIKSTAERARPEQAGLAVTLRTTHHSGSSFPSNHAANAFAGAGVLSAAFPAGTPAFFAGAAAIAYSRVYVGVHFPIDVIAGALLGWLISFAVRIGLRNLIVRGELTEANRIERDEAAIERASRNDRMRR